MSQHHTPRVAKKIGGTLEFLDAVLQGMQWALPTFALLVLVAGALKG